MVKHLAYDRPVIFCLGANHKTADIEVREHLYLSDEELSAGIPHIMGLFQFKELFVLSTCNRFELLGVDSAKDLTESKIFDAYLELQKYSGKTRDISTEELRKNCYVHYDREAIKHAISVASSLDSLVIGETQITGQFKSAVNLAKHIEVLGPLTNRLSQEALATAKKVRSQTEIGKKTISIAHVAIELAKKVFGDISEHKVLIIGAGEMSQVAAKYAFKHNPKSLYVANRTFENGIRMIADLGLSEGQVFSLNELGGLLNQVDIVISSTSSQDQIVNYNLVKRVMDSRRSRSLVLIDIAIPRDIDSRCSQLDDVYLFDIDDLKQVVDTNFDERKRAAQKASSLVEEGVANFERWLDALPVGPAIADFQGYLTGIIEKEVKKTMAKDAFREMSVAQKDHLESLLKAIKSRIVQDVSKSLKSPPESHYPDQLTEAIRVLFLQHLVEKEKKGEK